MKISIKEFWVSWMIASFGPLISLLCYFDRGPSWTYEGWMAISFTFVVRSLFFAGGFYLIQTMGR